MNRNKIKELITVLAKHDLCKLSEKTRFLKAEMNALAL